MKSMHLLMLMAVCLVLNAARPLAAQEPFPKHDVELDLRQFHEPSSEPGVKPAAVSWFDGWLAQEYMFGNWGGLRTKLLNLGVTPSITFATDVLGNPVGGKRRPARIRQPGIGCQSRFR
jgi:porin